MPDLQVQDEEEIVPPSDQKTQEWIAVLAAADIDFSLSCIHGQWKIHVARSRSGAARSELEAYEADCLTWPAVAPLMSIAWKPKHHTAAALWGSGLMVALYAWFGPYDGGIPMLRAGSADAEAILAGQWWRAITALTLHSGFTHLAGNVLCLLFLGQAVCGLLGGGLGWALMLGSGVAGNVAVAFLFKADHVGVGASTASFGAIGILAAHQSVQMLRRWREWQSVWSRVWIPLGSGIALLALLGTSPGSDFAAHAFGFVFGVVLSLPFCLLSIRWMPEWAQRLLELLCVCLVLLAWAEARKSG